MLYNSILPQQAPLLAWQWRARISPASVDLLHSGATAATASTSARHTARHVWHTTFTTSSGLVDLHHDRVHDSFELLLLSFELLLLCQLVLVEPVQCFLHGCFNLIFVTSFEFILELLLLKCVPHGKAIIFEAVLGFNLGLVRLVLSAVLLRLVHHAVDFGLREAAFLVGDRNLVRLTCGLVLCGYVQNAVGIDIK